MTSDAARPAVLRLAAADNVAVALRPLRAGESVVVDDTGNPGGMTVFMHGYLTSN